ncbi:hypothetical protein YC2023_039815 [Brassica napus]
MMVVEQKKEEDDGNEDIVGDGDGRWLFIVSSILNISLDDVIQILGGAELHKASDSIIISYCLDGLENILRAGEAEKKKPGDVNCYSQLIVDAQGKEKIRNLQRCKNHEFRVLKTYCPLLLED